MTALDGRLGSRVGRGRPRCRPDDGCRAATSGLKVVRMLVASDITTLLVATLVAVAAEDTQHPDTARGLGSPSRCRSP